MRGKPAKQLKQLTRRAGALALTGFAFAVGIGVGALAITAQYAGAAAVGAEWTPTFEVEYTASREAWGTYGAAAGFEVLQPAADVHTVASALRVELPRSAPALGPLYSAAAIAKMVPGERAQATVTFYYCSGPAVGDGGGFCGHTADGTPVQPGVASCDRLFLGQKFRVVGDPLGMAFRCADTGGGVHGQHRDIWFQTAAEAAVWMAGVGRNATIEVLD